MERNSVDYHRACQRCGKRWPEGGTVVIQYCSFGPPTNDITQPDEAPSSACADHSGHWATLTRLTLDPSGDARSTSAPLGL